MIVEEEIKRHISDTIEKRDKDITDFICSLMVCGDDKDLFNTAIEILKIDNRDIRARDELIHILENNNIEIRYEPSKLKRIEGWSSLSTVVLHNNVEVFRA